MTRLQISTIRGAMIRAFHESFPSMTPADLARAIGVDSATVRFHLKNAGKTGAAPVFALTISPWMADGAADVEAERYLEAAEKFERIAATLRKFALASELKKAAA